MAFLRIPIEILASCNLSIQYTFEHGCHGSLAFVSSSALFTETLKELEIAVYFFYHVIMSTSNGKMFVNSERWFTETYFSVIPNL